MAKIDKTTLTKEQWHRIRDERRDNKKLKEQQTQLINSQSVVDEEPSTRNRTKVADNKKYIVCLKHGDKYDASYVNVLYNMVKRHCSLPFEFVCFTENTSGLSPDIITMPLPQIPAIKGWWYKPYFFSGDFPLKGSILYIDLDVIIFRNINKLFEFNLGKFCILKDFNRSLRPQWQKFNSSVFRLETGSKRSVYDNFLKDPLTPIKRFHGDQDWIYDQIKTDFYYWPNEWIQSYKWEMRGRPPMVRDRHGKRNFSAPGNPKILDETAIAVFHGEPNPHNCIDPWCKENWR